MLAILMATSGMEATGAALPRSLIRIGGLTLLERQARQLTKAGAERLIVFGAESEALRQEAERVRKLRGMAPLEWCASAQELLRAISEQHLVLWTEASCLLDERLLTDLIRHDREAIAVLPRENVKPEFRSRVYFAVSKGREIAIAKASCLTVSRLSLDRLQSLAGNPDAFFAVTLAQNPGMAFDISACDDYYYDLRRREPYFFFPIQSPDDNPAAKRALLNAAQKSVLDWPAWYLHRPIEKAIIYHVCEWPITPNQLTVLNNIVAFLGVYLFATGQLLGAMVAALCVGVLDGLDGKQARVKVMTSKLGRYEELLDKIYENSWYLAIAYFLATHGFGQAPYALFLFILGCNLADMVVGGIYKAQRGVQLDDAGDFERRFRVISGRRNTYMWTLLPFALAAVLGGQLVAFQAGFTVIAAYALLTVAVRMTRLLVRLREPRHAV